MDTSIALNRLRKVGKVRRSARELHRRGDYAGSLTLFRVANRNESEVYAARPDLHPFAR